MPPQLVKISRWCKDKQSLAQYVMEKEAENGKGENTTSIPKSSVFDRLQPLTSQQRPSAFSRIRKDKTAKPSVLRKLEGGKQPKLSVSPE